MSWESLPPARARKERVEDGKTNITYSKSPHQKRGKAMIRRTRGALRWDGEGILPRGLRAGRTWKVEKYMMGDHSAGLAGQRLGKRGCTSRGAQGRKSAGKPRSLMKMRADKSDPCNVWGGGKRRKKRSLLRPAPRLTQTGRKKRRRDGVESSKTSSALTNRIERSQEGHSRTHSSETTKKKPGTRGGT